MVIYQLIFKITNNLESEMMDTAIFLKDNYAALIHQVNGDSDTFLINGTLEIADYNSLVSTIQAFKAEFSDRLWYKFAMDKDMV